MPQKISWKFYSGVPRACQENENEMEKKMEKFLAQKTLFKYFGPPMTTNSELNTITHIWTRFNLRWILSGIFSALGAGILAMVIASIFTAKTFGDWSQSLKLLAAIRYGGEALAFDAPVFIMAYGASLHASLCILYGSLFAQLVNEKSSPLSLVILGWVTSAIVWVFGFQLFMPTFDPYLRMITPLWVGLFLHFTFGISFGLILSLFRQKN